MKRISAYGLRYMALVLGLCLLASACSPLDTVVRPEAMPPVHTTLIASDHPYMLARSLVERRDPTSDFHQLRLSYTETTHYQPYTSIEEDLQETMLAALNEGDFEPCIAAAMVLLDYNYASLPGHFAAFRCYEASQQAERASFHRWALDGLLDDVQSKGDGSVPQQAYLSYSVNELHWVLALLGLQAKAQGVVRNELGVFDRMTVVQEGSEEELVLYFDISVQMSRGLAKLLGHLDEEET